MISLHIIVDFADPARLDRALLYLTRTHQKTVNIAGGAQLDRAMQYAERVRAAMPDIVIQFRILEDTGIIMKLTPADWYAKYIAPRLEWFQKFKIVPVIDNETSGDDRVIMTYVERESLVLDMLHTVNLNGVVCRFATGNIGDGSNGTTNQYPLLKPLLEKLKPGDWVSPNEYSNAPPGSSGGHLERYKRIEAIAGHPLNMSIGEAGILFNYQAKTGYRKINMSGKDMAAQLISEEIWYRGGSIPRHAYCIGGNADWTTLQIGDDALEFWEDYYAKNPISAEPKTEPPVVITPTPPPPLPPPPPVPPPPAVQMVSVPITVLQAIRTVLQAEANSTRSLALQLGGISDDLLGNVQLLDAIIQKANVNEPVKK